MAVDALSKLDDLRLKKRRKRVVRLVPCPKDPVLVQCGKLEVWKSVEKREQGSWVLLLVKERKGWIKEMDSDFEKRLLTPRSVYYCFQRIGLMIDGSLFRNGRGGPSNVVGTPPSQNVDPFTSVPARKLSLLQYWRKYWTASHDYSATILSHVAAENGQASAHPCQFPSKGLPLTFSW